MLRKLDMVQIFKNAFEERRNVPYEQFKEECKNLLTHLFVAAEKVFKEYCDNSNSKYNDDIFYATQNILVYIALADGEFLQGEYDIYKLFCNWVNIEPLSVEDFKTLYERLNDKTVIDAIKVYLTCRMTMDPADYQALVSALSYFAYAGDNEIDEKEYYIIRAFYDPKFDNVPLTWQEFDRLVNFNK